MTSLFELRQFSHTYLEGTPLAVPAIRDVSLSIESGERVAIVGGTQSGKTTLAHSFAALLRLRPNQVFYRGADVAGSDFDRTALRRDVAIAFQDASAQLVEDVVGKDVAFGPTLAGVPAAETRQRVEDSLNAVGLQYEVFRLRYVHALSGGQTRRAALAGVLAMRSPVVVMDEPLVGLDPAGRRDLLGVLRELSDDPERTLIVLENGIGEAALLCDRLVVLAGGSITLDTPLDDALADVDQLVERGVTLPETVEIAREVRKLFPDFPINVKDEATLETALVARLG